MHIFFNISGVKCNQTIIFGQLIKSNKRNFFFKNNAENGAGRLVADLFLLFKKALYKVKTNGLQLGFNIF